MRISILIFSIIVSVLVVGCGDNASPESSQSAETASPSIDAKNSFMEGLAYYNADPLITHRLPNILNKPPNMVTKTPNFI